MDQPRIDPSIYRAAMECGRQDDASKFEADLHNVTPGKGNTLLHLAAAAGNVDFINQLLRKPEVKPELVRATNIRGNTALHEAAQRGYHQVVEALLLHHKTDLINLTNNLNQTAVFKACEGGDLPTVRMLAVADPSALCQKSADGRTCLHVAVNRLDPDLLNYLLNGVRESQNLVEEKDNNGDTVLHLAVKRNCVYTVKTLLQFQPKLCYDTNGNGETPLCVAAKLGFLDVIEELINSRRDSLEIADRNGKNVLHLAVEHRHVNVVKFLTEKVDLSELINEPDEPQKSTSHNKEVFSDNDDQLPNPPESGEDKDTDHSTNKKDERRNLLEDGGNTPLHIAASIKNLQMVELLLHVPGVNKEAVNNQGVTPLDIARDNTEYYKSYKIIESLTSYPPRCKPFLYNVPTVSETKYKQSMKTLEKAYSDRRNTELVVAVLLATMAFSAVFQIPGGFRTDDANVDRSGAGSPAPAPAPDPSGQDPLGAPNLIHYDSFKLFLIFDSVAFFLSLFVVLMWTVSTPLTTGDQMLFMCITVTVISLAFAFVTYGFMCAVYAVLAHGTNTMLAWIILGSSTLICLGGNVAGLYILVKFAVKRARFHRVCGVPRLLDNKIEKIWIQAEKRGILDFLRYIEKRCLSLLTGICPRGKETPIITLKSDKDAKCAGGSSSSCRPPEVGQERV